MEETNEIRFMQEYRENVITKIDELQNKLNLVINESLDDMKTTILDFNNKINNKLKIIESKFKTIQDENEKMKKEISSNKFDESNFQNVSMIRKMNKEVYEKNIKITELESRIKLLESRSKPGEVFDIKMSNLNEIITDKSKPGKSKIKENPVNIENETIPTAVEIVKETEQLLPVTVILQVDAENVTVKQEKTAPEIEIKKIVENIPEAPVIVPVNDSKTKPETVKKSTRSKTVKPKIVEIIKDDDEPVILEPIVKKTVSITKKGASKSKLESKNTIETNNPPVIHETEHIQPPVLNSQEDKKKIIEKPNEVVEKPKEVIEKPKIKVSYPDNIPDYDNIEIVEINSVDYYKDINNNNIYQIMQDDNIGIFLGIYDKDTISIIPFNDF